MNQIGITDIENIKIGHAEDLIAGTGCTVIICEKGAATGVDVRGGAPGTRETDLLNPVNLVEKIHAVFLAGGSAFGLNAASGIMKYLEEKNIGFDVQVTKVPIVSGAVLFDLTVGDYKIRPDENMGYRACLNSETPGNKQGNIGAGSGCSVGKLFGIERSMKSGLGTYALQAGKLKVGAVVAVNCLGNVIDPETGEGIAGLLNESLSRIISTEEEMIRSYEYKKNLFSGNTTIGVVATNAKLNKAQATKVSSMAHNGYARTIRPSHTMFDGDTIFTMSVGEIEADLSVVGLLAAKAVERAVVESVKKTASLFGLKSFAEIKID